MGIIPCSSIVILVPLTVLVVIMGSFVELYFLVDQALPQFPSSTKMYLVRAPHAAALRKRPTTYYVLIKAIPRTSTATDYGAAVVAYYTNSG